MSRALFAIADEELGTQRADGIGGRSDLAATGARRWYDQTRSLETDERAVALGARRGRRGPR